MAGGAARLLHVAAQMSVAPRRMRCLVCTCDMLDVYHWCRFHSLLTITAPNLVGINTLLMHSREPSRGKRQKHAVWLHRAIIPIPQIPEGP